MVKQPKPPKGGAPKQAVPRGRRTPPKHPGSQPGRITADEMYKSNNMYKDMMWKPGQVKTPEDMVVNEKFLEQLELLKAFADVKIESGVLEKYQTVYCGHETYEECMQVSADSNTMILLEALTKAAEQALKILGNGEITKPVKVKAQKFSESAKAKIEAAGGKVEEPC